MQDDSGKDQSKETQEKHDQQDHCQASQNHADKLLEKFIVRYAKPEDIPFIKKTWLYSYYNGKPENRRIKKDTFMREYSAEINNILMRPTTFVKVAHLPDEPDIIISFACLEYLDDCTILHYVYTKKMWRGMGAHNNLIPKYDFYSYITKIWEAICPKGPTYNPKLR